jgi:hypothetical protein
MQSYLTIWLYLVIYGQHATSPWHVSYLPKENFPHVNNVCKNDRLQNDFSLFFTCKCEVTWREGVKVSVSPVAAGSLQEFTSWPSPQIQRHWKGRRNFSPVQQNQLSWRKFIMGWPFWVDIRVIRKVTLSLPSLCASFHPLSPLSQWYPQSKEILLNLSMKCWNSAFSAQCSRLIIVLVQLGAEKKICSSSGSAQEKGKDRMKLVYHQKLVVF